MMHSTAIKLRIKRPAAVFLSFLLIAAITVCTVGAATLINGTIAENLASPKYYSTLKDWNSSTNSPESDNIFYYQFTMDKENLNWDYMTLKDWGYWYTGSTDYTNFTNLTEEQWAEKYNSNTFKHCCGIAPKGFMRLWNENACLSLIDIVPAVALAFQSKDDGYVNILAHSVDIAYNSDYFTKGQDYKALVRITNNGENVYPESGWLEVSDTATSVSIPELEIKVSSGDMIRFELTASENPANAASHGVAVCWKPQMFVRPTETLYTKTNDVFSGLTSFMETVFKGKTSEAMDSADALEVAKTSSKRSKYGVYTPFDSIYSGGIIPSDGDSVWKYAAALSIPDGFETPDTDYSLKAEKTENGIKISWNTDYSQGLKGIRVSIGEGSTYIADDSITDIVLPVTADENGFLVQVSGENGASEILKITTDSDSNFITNVLNYNKLIYLNTCKKTGTGITSSYVLTDSSFNSSYTFRYATNEVSSEESANTNRRTVIYNANKNEQMMFGFTAPQSGDYEITAPIETSANVTYSILKQDKNSNFTLIDGERKYETDKNGFSTLVALKLGETVWLKAVSYTETEIGIGIPRVTLKEQATDSNGNTAYKYRAVDYIESSAFNNRTYKTGSLTEKSGTPWEFGSFENPIATSNGVTNNDTLGFMNYTVGDSASSLTAVLKPYEIIRGGVWYNSLAMVVTSDGTINATYAAGVPGTMRTILGTDSSAKNNIGLPYLSKGFMATVGIDTGRDGKKHNMGVYMKFTAPMSGNITLNLSDFADAKTGCRVIVLKGDEVIATYGTIPKGTVVDLGYMNKGESAYICYGTASGKPYEYMGFPIAVVSGEKYTVSVNEKADYLLTENEKIALTSSQKIGKYVVSYNDSNGNTLNVNDTYTVTGNDTLTAVYRYYGDLDGDGKINAQDISVMRSYLLKTEESQDIIADVTSDSSIDLKDIVRMKKWLAGYVVALGGN